MPAAGIATAAIFFAASVPFGSSAGLAAALISLGGIITVLAILYQDKPGKYDLGRLKQIHERQEAAGIEIDEPKEYHSVHCLHCDCVYSTEFPTCPRCRHRC